MLDAIAAMQPASGQGCLVYATAHGVPERGLYLPADPRDPILTPERLDRALAQGCGNAPTVVVLSGCYAGLYLRPPLTRANRVILTAARRDRPSFGCGAGYVFTEFDDCMISAIEASRTVWRETFAAATACVAAREQTQNLTQSEPQAWFGNAVSALALPGRGP